MANWTTRPYTDLREEALWRPILNQRWRAQPALDQMGVSPRRQFMMLADTVATPRVTKDAISSEFDFYVELVVGDMAPAVAKADLTGGWYEPMSCEFDIGLVAKFPEIELFARPRFVGSWVAPAFRLELAVYSATASQRRPSPERSGPAPIGSESSKIP